MEQKDQKDKTEEQENDFPKHEKIEISIEEKEAMEAPRPRQIKPYEIKGLVPGKTYQWCACGLSAKDVRINIL